MAAFVYPSYYPDFSCIASRCKHSCCIGWEIDIDDESYAYYKSLRGAFADKLARSIDTEGQPHFILDEHERCPFLQKNGLCEMILTLGEDSLCEICREHPRFYKELSGSLEVGLGLACEEAARLVLTREEAVSLIVEGEREVFDEWESYLLTRREEVMARLQDRSLPMRERLSPLWDGKFDPEAAVAMLLSLEILDSAWKELLSRFRVSDREVFLCHMQGREREYEQFCVYLCYRYLLGAADGEDLAKKCALIVWAYNLLVSLGAFWYAERGDFTVEDAIELCRLFSSEIEYNEDNLEAILFSL